MKVRCEIEEDYIGNDDGRSSKVSKQLASAAACNRVMDELTVVVNGSFQMSQDVQTAKAIFTRNNFP